MSDPSNPDEVQRLAKPTVSRRFTGVIAAILAILLLIAIVWLVAPPGLVAGLVGHSVGSPSELEGVWREMGTPRAAVHRNRRGVMARAGDVRATFTRPGEENEDNQNNTEGEAPASAAWEVRFDFDGQGSLLVESTDIDRLVEARRRVLREEPVREALGLSEAELKHLREARRGTRLEVDPAASARVMQAFERWQQNPRDKAAENDLLTAVAAAGNTGREEFLARTRETVAALRQVLTDERLAQIE